MRSSRTPEQHEQVIRARRSARFDLREKARILAPNDRLRTCGSPLGGPVAVLGSQGAHCAYANIATCGSVWACPICSAKINARRSEEVKEAVMSWISTEGDIAMLTLTMRHTSAHSLQELWDALGVAWRAVIASSGWTNPKTGDKAVFGIEGYLRTVEVTHGDNGWHVHIHALLFAEQGAFASQTTTEALADRVFARWRTALVKQGMDAPLRYSREGKAVGVDLRRMTFEGGVADGIADYLAKMSNDIDPSAESRQAYAQAQRESEGIAFETTRSDLKTGESHKGGLTPFQLLERAVKASQHPDYDAYKSAVLQAEKARLDAYGKEYGLVEPGPGWAETEDATARAIAAGQTAYDEVMAQAGVTKPFRIAQWEEWVAASHGRRQQTWSRGLRARLGLSASKTDNEVAAEEPDAPDYFNIDGDDFKKVRRTPGALGRVLDLAETLGRAAVDQYLLSLNLKVTADPSGWRPGREQYMAGPEPLW